MRQHLRSTIERRDARGKKRMLNNEFSSLMGRDSSWATRFFNGQVKTLTLGDLEIIERERES